MLQDKPERILRLSSVLHRTGLSRSTLYRLISAGAFPGQVRIAPRCVGWREAHVDAWLERTLVLASGAVRTTGV